MSCADGRQKEALLRNEISVYDSSASESDANANANTTRRSHHGWTRQQPQPQPQPQRNVNWSNAPTDINRYHSEANWYDHPRYADGDVQNSGPGSGLNATSHVTLAGQYPVQFGAMSNYGRPIDHDFRSCSRHDDGCFYQNAAPDDDNRNRRTVARSSTGEVRTGSNFCAVHTPWFRDDRMT